MLLILASIIPDPRVPCVGVSLRVVVSLHASASARGNFNVRVMYTSYLYKSVDACKWASGESLHQLRRLSLLINLRCVLIQFRSNWHPPGRELPVAALCRPATLSSPTATVYGFYLASFATTSINTAEDNVHFCDADLLQHPFDI